MDVVITYVDGNDPEWKEAYERSTNIPIMHKRFRDWGTLKYVLRGIEKNMPFVRNVYLVVASPSQVPSWVDSENLRIVLHKDIIPEKYLPTFNANPIEMHLHRIPGLADRFIYFNDDMFPVSPCLPEDFFRDGKAVTGISSHFLAFGMFKQICRNSDRLAAKAAGKTPGLRFLRPQHTPSPMMKSVSEYLYSAFPAEIGETSSHRTRTEKDLTQYLFLDYMYHKDMLENCRISSKHVSVALSSEKSLRRHILNPSFKILCINDVRLSEEKFERLRSAAIEAFEQKFPSPSKYEIMN